MTFYPGVKDQRMSAHPADGPHPEEGLGPPLGGDPEHPFDVVDLPEGGVDLLGGGIEAGEVDLAFEGGPGHVVAIDVGAEAKLKKTNLKVVFLRA